MASGTHCELSNVERTERKIDSIWRSMRSAIDSTMSARSCGLSDMLATDMLMLVMGNSNDGDPSQGSGRGCLRRRCHHSIGWMRASKNGHVPAREEFPPLARRFVRSLEFIQPA